MKRPFPEQVEAAKAYTRDEETAKQLLLLRQYDETDASTRNAARILLAALEEAEADLAWMEKVFPRHETASDGTGTYHQLWIDGECYRGATLREAIAAVRKDQP